MDKKDHYCVADSLGAGACPCGRMVTSEEEIKSPNAVVLIEYDSEGASMAAAYGPTETRSYSEIYEIYGIGRDDAISTAREKWNSLNKGGYSTLRAVKFIRWIDSAKETP